MKFTILSFFSFLILFSCKQNNVVKLHYFPASQLEYIYNGRTEMLNDTSVTLINSASSVEFTADGDFLNIYLSCRTGEHNYVSLEINGAYDKRYKLEVDQLNKISFLLPNKTGNKIGIYKATEASNGSINFHGVDAESISTVQNQKTSMIEFIGNSITCGMGADILEIPCDSGVWYDQHNAYMAYGSLVARVLGASFILNSVSGIGMYRNWNDENIEEAILPQVYGNLYLNLDSTKKYLPLAHPDIVSICIGTNDLSEGDGTKPRLTFNKEKYINNYKEFVENIYKLHPNTKVALLTSPMVSGEKGELLLECLREIESKFKMDHSITIFEFEPMTPQGCGYHPDMDDHKKMANQLIPFYSNLLKS